MANQLQINEKALEIATQITIAAVQNPSTKVHPISSELVGNFFGSVYKEVLATVQQAYSNKD